MHAKIARNDIVVYQTPRRACLAPGCFKRRAHRLVVGDFEFCDIACADKYTAWWKRVQEQDRLRLEMLKTRIVAADLSAKIKRVFSEIGTKTERMTQNETR